MPNTPTPQEFCERAQFRHDGTRMVARLDSVIYNVDPYGDDAVQIVTLTGEVVAILTMRKGKFVPAG